jgi:hypothetical protein
MYQSLVFVARSVPSENELHCLVTQLTDKQPIPAKVIRNGRVIGIVSATGAIAPKTLAIDTNAFEFKRVEAVQPYAAQIGDVATVSTQLCYTINKTAKGGAKGHTVSPIDAYGRIKPDCKAHFLAYLEKHTGLVGLVDGVAEIGINPWGMPIDDARKSKVWFVGAMELSMCARVGNPAVFNALAGVAIGNRRSYGFGAVSCDMLEKAPATALVSEAA